MHWVPTIVFPVQQITLKFFEKMIQIKLILGEPVKNRREKGTFSGAQLLVTTGTAYVSVK